jgi:hypothetical protein
LAPFTSASVAALEVDDVVAAVELAHQLAAVALQVPGGELAGVEAKGNGAAERKHLALAEEIVRRGVRHLDGGRLHAVDHAEGGHQLTGRGDADLELAAGALADALGHVVGGTEDRVERLREA